MGAGSESVAPPVGTYEPLLELGRGGMGVVLLARAVGAGRFERLVVLKRMHEWLLKHPDAIDRFLHEAHLASTIHHANVVAIHQVGKDERGYFLVLDYIEGASLEELGDRCSLRSEHVPPPILLRIALDSLAGLSAAHDACDTTGRPLSILHRDVSLQNVLVGRDGVARIADFGIAKSDIAAVSTDRSYLVGKLIYVPPEHLQRRPATPAFDIYSLGITLWMALTGDDPWGAADEAQLVHRILSERVPPVSAAGIPIAPQLQALLDRACDPEPSARFASAREMSDAIVALDRHTGWIASHAEVADWVGGLMDVDLGRRRAAVSELGASAPTRKLKAIASAPTPGAAVTMTPARDSTVGEARKPWTLVVFAAGSALALTAGLAAWTTLGSGRDPPPGAEQSTGMNSVAATACAAPASAAAPTASAGLDAPIPDAAGATESVPAPTRRPPPVTLVHPDAGPPAVPTHTSEPAGPARTKEPTGPTDDEISKHNPYR